MNQPHPKETKVTYISKEDLHLLRRDSHNLSSLIRDLHGDLDRLDEHLNVRQYHAIVNIAKSLNQ